MGIAGLLVGSIAYYRIVVSWSIEGSTGNAVFVLRDTYRPYIRTITFGNDLSNLPSSCAGDSDLCWDVSDAGSKKKVYAYLIDSGLKDENEQSLYNLYIVSEAPIFAPPDCSLFFAGFNNLISINYNGMIPGALNDANVYAIISYTIDTQSIAETMKATNKFNQSKITLKQI